MSRTIYEVIVIGESVADLPGNPATNDLEQMKDAARKMSALREGTVVEVVSHVIPTDTGVPTSEWRAVVATFTDGEEVDPEELEAAAEELGAYYNPHFPEN